MATEETAAARFARDYSQMGTVDTNGDPDDRKERQLELQSDERQARLYVDHTTVERDENGVPLVYSGTSATGKTYDPEA